MEPTRSIPHCFGGCLTCMSNLERPNYSGLGPVATNTRPPCLSGTIATQGLLDGRVKQKAPPTVQGAQSGRTRGTHGQVGGRPRAWAAGAFHDATGGNGGQG